MPSSDPTRSSGQHRTTHAGEDSCAHAALFSGAGPAPSLCVRSSGCGRPLQVLLGQAAASQQEAHSAHSAHSALRAASGSWPFAFSV